MTEQGYRTFCELCAFESGVSPNITFRHNPTDSVSRCRSGSTALRYWSYAEASRKIWDIQLPIRPHPPVQIITI
jgi:hypothetical protein